MTRIMNTMSVLRIWIRMRCIGSLPDSFGNVRIIVREMSTVLLENRCSPYGRGTAIHKKNIFNKNKTVVCQEILSIQLSFCVILFAFVEADFI